MADQPAAHRKMAAEKRTSPQNWTARTKFRIAATFYSFFVMGANDAAYGPIIPYLEEYYSISYTIVSLVFLSPFIGYVSSALLNNYLHHRIGQRGVAIVGSTAHIAAYIIMCTHPPYAVLVVAAILAGFGNGVADAAWNAWVSGLPNASELLGFLHASYGAGGVVSPLIATSLVTKAGLQWYTFYYIMIGLAVAEFALLASSFWDSTGAVYRGLHTAQDKVVSLTQGILRKPAARISWTAAIYLLCYMGAEVALGGWIVTFMRKVRHGADFASGMVAVGFWLGITVGRAVLGFVTPRVGLKVSTAIYLALAMGLELVFWLVPQFYVSAVAVSLQGFFLGPMFPSAVMVVSKLLPQEYHVVVIGFAAAFGGCGAALLPFLTGLLAQSQGPAVLQPIILALLGAMLAIWLTFPRLGAKSTVSSV